MAQREDVLGCVAVTRPDRGKPFAIFVADRCGIEQKALTWIIKNKHLIPDDAKDGLLEWLAVNDDTGTPMTLGQRKEVIPMFLRELRKQKIKIGFEIYTDVPLSFWRQKR